MKLEDIVEHYGTMVATIAHRMIQNREIAKEAAQEVWYEVFKSNSGPCRKSNIPVLMRNGKSGSKKDVTGA